MKTSKKMQAVITQIAKKHGLNLTATGARLRLDMSGFDRLVIENVGKNQVLVAHYYEPASTAGRQGGKVIADPEIIFFTGHTEWVPIKVAQVFGGRRVYAVPSPDGASIVVVDPESQADLAEFSEMWGDNIEAQGWLEQGKKWGRCDPANYDQPSLEMLMAWEAEGGCEAVDGCWTEPDGTCTHGCKSWLLVLGLI